MSASPSRCFTIPPESGSMVERLSALAAVYRPGDFGMVDQQGPGVIIAERRPLATVQVAARADEGKAVRDALATALGVAPDAAANRSATRDATIILWAGPERWLVVEPERSPCRNIGGSHRSRPRPYDAAPRRAALPRPPRQGQRDRFPSSGFCRRGLRTRSARPCRRALPCDRRQTVLRSPHRPLLCPDGVGVVDRSRGGIRVPGRAANSLRSGSWSWASLSIYSLR